MEDMTIAAVAAPSAADSNDTALVSADPADTGDTAAAEEEVVSQTGEAAPDATASSINEDVYLPVYNGEVRPLKASEREEITTLLQLGLKQRAFLPSYERLRALAAANGAKSVQAYIDGLCKTQEEQCRQEAITRYGEEAGARVYELERAAREAAAPPEETAVQSVSDTDRLAAEFAALRKEWSQYHSLRDVPPAVIEIAVKNGISLLDAHNRHVLAEVKRQSRRASDDEAAAVGSSGSLADSGDRKAPSVLEAFRVGLNRRM